MIIIIIIISVPLPVCQRGTEALRRNGTSELADNFLNQLLL